jgi:hypothetical protein
MWSLRPVVPPVLLSRLKVGTTTTSEVERLLGSPSDHTKSGEWIYERLFNPGYLGLTFDKDGRLVGFRHDSVLKW